MAIKQPPLRPPPYVFGPVWTLLYGLMGYAGYRAWNTGMNSSFDPAKVELTKVRYVESWTEQDEPMANITRELARRNPLHCPARTQPYVDASLLWTSASS